MDNELKKARAAARAAARLARRESLTADFTAEQISTLTRGLDLTVYIRAFTAGARRNTNLDLDLAQERYMARGTKTEAHENAFLDGNTYNDCTPEEYLRDRINHPEYY